MTFEEQKAKEGVADEVAKVVQAQLNAANLPFLLVIAVPDACDEAEDCSVGMHMYTNMSKASLVKDMANSVVEAYGGEETEFSELKDGVFVPEERPC